MRRNSTRVSMVLVMAFAVILAFGSSSAPAQSGGGKRWWTSTTARQQLALTNDQVERIDALQQAYREQIASIRREEARSLREMVSALDDPNASSGLIEEKRKQLDKAGSIHLRATTDHWISLRQILTTEQWKELPNVAPGVFRMGMMSLRVRSPAKNPSGNN